MNKKLQRDSEMGHYFWHYEGREAPLARGLKQIYLNPQEQLHYLSQGLIIEKKFLLNNGLQ